MWGVASVTPRLEATPTLQAAAILAAVAGICFDIAGISSFHRARTTVNPLRPERATSLVTSGVYRITRNPMYVGMLFILVSWALFLSSLWALLGPVAFILYMNRFQIRPEEQALARIFGDGFTAYTNKVRRWL